jgi:DNA ligase-1
MDTLLHFKSFYEEIRSSNSRKHKQWVLDRFKNDKVIKRYLQIAFDPYKRYGLNYPKLSKVVRVENTWCAPTVFDLFDYLEVHNTGRDVDVAVCQLALDWLVSVEDIDSYNLLCKLICKDISIGVDAKQINAVMPGLIPQFACQLAEKYFDKPEKIAGKEFAITTKLDGFRLIVFKNADGSIECYSRVGQLVEGLVEIEADLAALPCNTALDGELTITNYFDMPSKEAYKAASKIIRLKGATPKRGLTYRVFDCMKADEFKMQSCIKPYAERRAELDSFPKMDHIEVLPVLYVGDDTSKITEWLDKITAEGGEGCMLNSLWAPYVWGRTWNLQKCKKFQSLDLLVVDMEEGSGRLAGTLGAIHVRYKDGNIVKVGSGFSDEERALYWAQPDLILNKIVEVKYFESSKNADGTESLRFPTWTSNIRDPRDKATPDF